MSKQSASIKTCVLFQCDLLLLRNKSLRCMVQDISHITVVSIWVDSQHAIKRHSIMMLVKFLTSANQKYRIWSYDESGLCNPRPSLLGDEVAVGNVIRHILQDKTNKINCKEK